MPGYKLRRCDVCGKFHASYLVPDPERGKLYLCTTCWQARYSAQPPAAPDPDTERPDEEAGIGPPLATPPERSEP